MGEVAANITINLSEIAGKVVSIDPTAVVQEICSKWDDAIYSSWNFIFIMLMLHIAFVGISVRWPKFLAFKLRRKELKFVKTLFKGNPEAYKQLQRFGLTYIDAYEGSIVKIIANVMQKAMWFRIIQIWLNLKFRYHLI
jgi:hypothetical protein